MTLGVDGRTRVRFLAKPFLFPNRYITHLTLPPKLVGDPWSTLTWYIRAICTFGRDADVWPSSAHNGVQRPKEGECCEDRCSLQLCVVGYSFTSSLTGIMTVAWFRGSELLYLKTDEGKENMSIITFSGARIKPKIYYKNVKLAIFWNSWRNVGWYFCWENFGAHTNDRNSWNWQMIIFPQRKGAADP